MTCYEAGAFAFHLHRRYEELGIKSYVVQTQDCDERDKGERNDRLDAAGPLRYASDACRDGMVDDALATRLQAAQEMCARALQSHAERRLKEKAVVAMACQLAVDLWQIFTGAAKAE